MKTIIDVKSDISTLYNDLRSGAIDLKLASELANIAGKYIRIVQLEYAREIFLSGSSQYTPDPAGRVPTKHLPGETKRTHGSRNNA